jgi:hypothetical protein
MNRTVQAIMRHMVLPPTRAEHLSKTNRPTARCQSGLQTPSGAAQWKLRLELPRPQRREP